MLFAAITIGCLFPEGPNADKIRKLLVDGKLTELFDGYIEQFQPALTGTGFVATEYHLVDFADADPVIVYHTQQNVVRPLREIQIDPNIAMRYDAKDLSGQLMSVTSSMQSQVSQLATAETFDQVDEIRRRMEPLVERLKQINNELAGAVPVDYKTPLVDLYCAVRDLFASYEYSMGMMETGAVDEAVAKAKTVLGVPREA